MLGWWGTPGHWPSLPFILKPVGTPCTGRQQLMDGNGLCSRWYCRWTMRCRGPCPFGTGKGQRVILQLKMKQCKAFSRQLREQIQGGIGLGMGQAGTC